MARSKQAGRKRRRTEDNQTALPAAILPESFRALLKETSDLTRQARASWDEVGITEFVVDGEPVAAYIKQRFSDFIVNEIDQNGNVVRLTSCSNPNPVEEEIVEKFSDEEILQQFSSIIEDYDEFLKFLKSEDVKEFTLNDIAEKEKRSQIHSLLKQYQAVSLFSQTICNDNGKKVQICKGRPPSGNSFNSRKFAGGKQLYLQMALHKENVETMKAVNALSQIVRLPVGRFSYAGNKDRRGITTQLVTAFKLDAGHLINALPRLRPDVRIGNLQYVDDALSLGSLSGNRFGVVLRDVQYPEAFSDRDLERSLESASCSGFINYFGLQRFGTGAVSTHRIGEAILQNRFDLAIALILTPQPTQSEELRTALQHLTETGDINGTLGRLGRRDFIERTVLQYLSRFPNNYSNALDRLPRNMKTLYVHAYQSWIWNLMASYRLKDYDRHHPIAGDLVMDPSDPECKSVIVIDEDNLSKYSIFDVVLPLPGHSIVLPEHGVGQYCRELLASHQLSLESLDHRVRDYKLAGTYRPLFVKPGDMQWRFYRYNDTTIPLLRSDNDVLNGVEDPKSVVDGEKLAVCMEFSLPASSYATMLIREVLKREPLDWFAKDEIVAEEIEEEVPEATIA